ncbi:UDP-N-acetylmuramoylalanine--D-glutamate ligase [hydrothermal vent metagenome]|uniref:UDP-N-acetylmuramoylalanine--D-glutamate ligase n=1 Tax=hydrothermal vent metagenome TaxID=652676 RepID=A0A1W1DGM7_9ZZZZ
MIAGGIAKQEDYSALFELIDKDVASVVLIGQSAQELGRGIHQAQIHYADSMDEAVSLASTMINDGVVLLSPACASFDMFDNFEARGEAFKKAILG